MTLEQLRSIGEAADRIRALEAENTTLREQLSKLAETVRPFAAIADHYAPQEDDLFPVFRDFDVLGPKLLLGMFRRATQALTDYQAFKGKTSRG